MKKIITWVKPTGSGLHLGNYFWAIKPFIDLSEGKDGYFMLADFHALTSVHDGDTLREYKKNMLLEYFALLGHDSKITVFQQSKVRRINDITWILSSVTPYSLMLRAHSFKDSQNKNSEINMATFNYPILMTADIITYDMDIVPVGKDQKQHLEFTRDIAGYFNKTYKKEVFKLPEAHIEETVQTIPGTDGRKMSKSYDNFIPIFESEKVIKKKIMSIETDDTPLEDSKNPDTCNVFALIKLMASQERQEEIRQKYLAGNYGYGHAKLELLEIFLEYFQEARELKQQLEENIDEMYNKLEVGNRIANEMADKKYNEVKDAVGL